MKLFIQQLPTILLQTKLRFQMHTFQPGLICIALLLGAATFKSDVNNQRIDSSVLVGTWQVDLRAKPSDPPYYQEFVVASVDENGFTGTFYNTEIKKGKINTEWGLLTFAFVTSDGSGVYNTSGQFKNAKLEGSTHSLGRDFLMPWRAERKNSKQ